MTSIVGAEAIHDITRILPQHQSALTLLNSKLQNPSVQSILWLDLACGKGQIITQLDENLTLRQRQKLSYVGYDINPEYTQIAGHMANRLSLLSFEFIHGDMSSFDRIITPERCFDFITCTNTAHELHPGAFAKLFLNALIRLASTGEFFIYDMESLVKPELGALPWKSTEIEALLNSAFEVLGTDYRVAPSCWKHSTCNGWSVTIQREYINKNNAEIQTAWDIISSRLDDEIDMILSRRLEECYNLLNTLSLFKADTLEDVSAIPSALYEFWALHRAKRVRT